MPKKIISFDVEQVEYEKLVKIADFNKMTLAEVIRICTKYALNELKRKGTFKPKPTQYPDIDLTKTKPIKDVLKVINETLKEDEEE